MSFAQILDDAAIFPPGNLPLTEAVRAHLAHEISGHGDLVGPLVVGASDLPALAEHTAGLPVGNIEVSVTAPTPSAAADALDRIRTIRPVRLVGLEVAVPADLAADDVVAAVESAVGVPAGVTVYVEVPRDGRRDAVLEGLAGSSYLAKFRTGGVRADLHPDETELAACVVAAVRAGVAFKATAGLHHAVRNTDPETGFEQHGFLNLLAATDEALAGADVAQVRAWLAERDGARVAARVAALSSATRGFFRSFGTCSIADPVSELAELGLLAPEVEGVAQRPSQDPRSQPTEAAR